MQPGNTLAAARSALTTNSGLAAVITVVNSKHVELRSFAVEAASEAGILLDQIPRNRAWPFSKSLLNAVTNTDIAIEDLVITASTLPAIVAVDVTLLKIANNRIAMEDVASQWASVYASGTELHIDHNWVGLQDASNATNWASATVVADLASSLPTAAGGFGGTGATPGANGGIHIAGGSQDVFVIDNEIEGGLRNGITLGSFVLLDANGNDTGALTGVLATDPSSDNDHLAASDPRLQRRDKGYTRRREWAAEHSDFAQPHSQHGSVRHWTSGFLRSRPDPRGHQHRKPHHHRQYHFRLTAGRRRALRAQSQYRFGYGAICIPDVQNSDNPRQHYYRLWQYARSSGVRHFRPSRRTG